MVSRLLVAAVIAVALSACSAQKNTARSRWWHSFTARYNTYYNGHQAFLEGNEQKEKGNTDNYTEQLPMYMVGNKKSQSLGKSNYDRAIEKSEKTIRRHSIKSKPQWNKSRRKTDKDKEWLARREYNPFLWRAWMLLGKSQFQEGAFEEAAATFSYVSRLYQTQPAIRQQAQSWLARTYVELDWMYEAEDVIRKQARDSIHHRAARDWQTAQADYLLASGQLAEAVPLLRQVIQHDPHGYRKARHYYILGQVEAALGHEREAYRAFSRVQRQNPPYELSFNARIAQTEVMAAHSSHDGQLSKTARRMVRRLKGMARDDNNKEYLDQVYYAIGNIYMTVPDTLRALDAYEQGAAKATRSGLEKGVLLLRMGDIYWTMERFNDAQRCYGEAIGLLDKDRADYAQLAERSKVLDELVPHTDAIHLQDSLQQLAKMPEEQRLAAIDRVIEALKEKEKAERRAEQEAAVEKAGQQAQRQTGRNQQQNRQQTANAQDKNGTWYFYNPMAVSQGKQTFQRIWGKRENADNWQRSNITVVGGDMAADAAMPTDEAADSLRAAETETPNADDEGKQAANDSLQNDPHNREYYLAQIPFTDEQVAASDDIIKEALLQSGIIFKDKLDNLPLAEKQLQRLHTQYSDYPQMDLALYHMYLLYMRQRQTDRAEQCVAQLQQDYPQSEWTILLSDPYFAENQRFGQHIEDSLYAATYQAFLDQRYDVVFQNTNVANGRFPLGEHRPKFLFVEGLAWLNSGNADSCLVRMKTVVEKHPQSDVAEMAGMIVKGVGEGRVLHGGSFDLGDVWSLRGLVATQDSTQQDTLSVERNTAFYFILAYQPDSLLIDGASGATHATANENKLLFHIARYNFTNFLVRNFELQVDRDEAVHRLTVSGFMSYDEALQYARQLYSDPQMARLLRPCRRIVISEENLPLLGTRVSYNDYELFYQQHLQPLEVSDEQLLLRPDVIVQPSEDDADTQGEADDDGGSQQPGDDFFDFGDDFF